jgi:hypothetical protein
VVAGLDWFAGSIVDQLDTGDHVGFVLAPFGGRHQRSSRPLTESELGDLEAGHPVPDD